MFVHALLTDESQLWEFIPGFDDPTAFDAFSHYRDTGSKRSIVRTARDLGASPGAVYRWAQIFLWRDRVLSYDTFRTRERESLRTQTERAADVRWAERRAALLDDFTEVAEVAVGQLRNKLRTRPGGMRDADVIRLLDRITHWQNIANGDATDKVDVGLDLANMSDEQLAALEPVLRQLAAQKASDDDGSEE